MQEGQIVTVYYDPLTMRKVEGKAKLLRMLSKDFELEYWDVCFTKDSQCCYRCFKRYM